MRQPDVVHRVRNCREGWGSGLSDGSHSWPSPRGPGVHIMCETKSLRHFPKAKQNLLCRSFKKKSHFTLTTGKGFARLKKKKRVAVWDTEECDKEAYLTTCVFQTSRVYSNALKWDTFKLIYRIYIHPKPVGNMKLKSLSAQVSAINWWLFWQSSQGTRSGNSRQLSQ